MTPRRIPIGLDLIAPAGRDLEAGFRTYESWLDNLAAHRGNHIGAWLSNPFWDVEGERLAGPEPNCGGTFGRFAEVVSVIHSAQVPAPDAGPPADLPG
jgi:hypothetical protein